MSRTRNIIIVYILIVALLFSAAFYISNSPIRFFLSNISIGNERFTLPAAEHWGEMSFSNSLGFDVGRRNFTFVQNSGYTRFVFVHSEEEFLTENFRDNVIVVWPSIATHTRLNEINDWIRRNERQGDLNAFLLSYPLTVEDISGNWRNVRRFLRSIGDTANNEIRQRSVDANERIKSAELVNLLEAFEVAGIDISEYGLGFYIRFNQYNYFFARSSASRRLIIFELYDRLEEDVQKQLLVEIPRLMELYRADFREYEWRKARQQARQQ